MRSSDGRLAMEDKALLDVLDSHEHVRTAVLERDASRTDDDELAHFAAAALCASREAADARSVMVANSRTGALSRHIDQARARRHHPVNRGAADAQSRHATLEVKQHVQLQRYYEAALAPKETRRAQQQQRTLDAASKLLDEEVARSRTREAILLHRSRRAQKERCALSCACHAGAATAVSSHRPSSSSSLCSVPPKSLGRDHPTAILKEARRLQAQDRLAQQQQTETRSVAHEGARPHPADQSLAPQRPVTDALARKVSSRVAMFMHSR